MGIIGILMLGWTEKRRLKGAEIVNQAKPYKSGLWLELGTGTGNNTIPLGKKVDFLLAIDVHGNELCQIKKKDPGIEAITADFRFLPIKMNSFFGVFAAFSMHFVAEQNIVFNSIFKHLKSEGMFIIIEYQTSNPKPWIPFPLPKKIAIYLLKEIGFREIRIQFENERYYILKSKKNKR